jgi:rhomboid protease GluP
MRWATPFLLGSNLIVYAVLAYLGYGTFGSDVLEIHRYYVDLLGLNREVLVEQGYVWQFLTSIFLHFDVTHLAYNLIFLVFFGFLAEETHGGSRTLLIFLASGIIVSLTVFIVYPAAVFGGSSGGVLGLVGASIDTRGKTSIPKIAALGALIVFIAVSGVYIAHFVGLISGTLVARTFPGEKT